LRDEIYRIAREALRNAFKHSQADKIEAQLTYGNSQFLVRVRDNGTGIDPGGFDQGRRSGHWGLPGMHERAKEFGGKVKVWSESGRGTEIELSVPASIAYGNSSVRPRFWFMRKAISETHDRQS
jgi:signal transduction histidine kinase